jgi:hypothetical protein
VVCGVQKPPLLSLLDVVPLGRVGLVVGPGDPLEERAARADVTLSANMDTPNAQLVTSRQGKANIVYVVRVDEHISRRQCLIRCPRTSGSPSCTGR